MSATVSGQAKLRRCQNRGGTLPPGSARGCLRLPERHPACSRCEIRPGFRTERENLHGDAKGKAQVAPIARPKVPMRRLGADCSVVVTKRGNARRAKGAGQRHELGSTGSYREEPECFSERRQPSCDGTSRMTRECHVRICERLGVKFPRADSANSEMQKPALDIRAALKSGPATTRARRLSLTRLRHRPIAS